MTQQTSIISIHQAIAALMALRSSMQQEELLKRFHQAREFLDRQPARSWNAEIELKTAYEYGLGLLESAHAAYVEEFRRKYTEFYKAN